MDGSTAARCVHGSRCAKRARQHSVATVSRSHDVCTAPRRPYGSKVCTAGTAAQRRHGFTAPRRVHGSTMSLRLQCVHSGHGSTASPRLHGCTMRRSCDVRGRQRSLVRQGYGQGFSLFCFCLFTSVCLRFDSCRVSVTPRVSCARILFLVKLIFIILVPRALHQQSLHADISMAEYIQP